MSGKKENPPAPFEKGGNLYPRSQAEALERNGTISWSLSCYTFSSFSLGTRIYKEENILAY